MAAARQIYSIRRPDIARAITSCWISRRAFEDRVDLGVAVPALDGVLAGVAVAAEDLDRFLGRPDRDLRCLVLVIEPSAFLKPPLRASQAARQISSRAASISVIMLASLKAIAWFMMIGLPNAWRSLA